MGFFRGEGETEEGFMCISETFGVRLRTVSVSFLIHAYFKFSCLKSVNA